MAAWMRWTAVSLVAYGLMSFLMKYSLGRLGWVAASVIAMVTEAVLVVGVCLVSGQWSLKGDLRVGVAAAVGVGVCSMVGFVGFMRACDTGDVSAVQIGVSAGTAVVLCLLAGMFLGERMDWPRALGLLFSVLGIVLLNCKP